MRKTLLVFASIYAVGVLVIGLTFSYSTLGKADFTFVSGAEPKSLDPAILTGQLEGRFSDALFEGLTYTDPASHENVPGMAERWEVSPDGKTWTFHMRAGAAWSNGDPVTARDFEWSWKRLLSPTVASEYAYLLWDVVNAEEYTRGAVTDAETVGVKALDDSTLRVTLDNAIPYFLDLTSFHTAAPVHRATVARWDADEVAPPGAWTLPGNIVGNGPFVLEAWIANDRIRLRKNPRYWNAGSIRLETIDALSIEDTTAALNAFLKGDADWNPANWPTSVNLALRRLPQLITTEAFITYFYRINTTRAPFRDPRVRRALSMAIDRTEIVRNVTQLGETAAYTCCPPGIPGYERPPGLGYDPKKARQLLEEAGYADPRAFPTIEILYNTHEGHKQTAVVVARQLHDNLGITVKPFSQEWQSYQADTRAMNYDLQRAGWIGDYLDPNTFMDLWITDGGNNQTGYSSALYDRLHKLTKDVVSFCEKPDDSLYGLLAEPDEMRLRVAAYREAPASDVEERLRRAWRVRTLMFKEMERLVCEIDCPIIPVYFYVTKNLVKPRVGGFHAYLAKPNGEQVPNVRDLHPLRGFFIEPQADAE
ncbi:MAG: peptide ABC transporter substrate-binding protein [Planctomycetota bacterium]